jgi:hypothetical protein
MPLRLLTTSLLLTALLGACSIATAQDETPPPTDFPTEDSPPPSPEIPTATPPETLPDSPTETPPTEEAEAVPQAYPEDRYLTMWDKNPFLLKTAVIEQKAESFAKDWALSGISATSGVYTVRIFNKQTGKFERLKQGSPGGSEFQLVSVIYDKDRSKSSVKVSRGTEIAELTYDDSLMSRPVTVQNTNAAATGAPGQNPGQPPNPNLPPGLPTGAQPNMQRGPNGQPIMNGAGAQGRPGTTALRGQINPNPGAINPATGAPIVNPAANGLPVPGPSYGVPGAANNGLPPPVSRRRQLIPAPIQQSQ